MIDINPVHPSGTCACGEHDEELPLLNAQEIPHAIRHGAILGALGQVRPGGAMLLEAPHDPKPLLKQVEDQFPKGFEITYEITGPDVWRLRFTRVAA